MDWNDLADRTLAGRDVTSDEEIERLAAALAAAIPEGCR